MRATIMYGAGDVRVETVPDARLDLHPTPLAKEPFFDNITMVMLEP
jgi:hypothetical protein